MIPEEVAVIAEELALHYKGSRDDYDQFIDLAYRIYNKLNLCKC